jgi:hypothetical protein
MRLSEREETLKRISRSDSAAAYRSAGGSAANPGVAVLNVVAVIPFNYINTIGIQPKFSIAGKTGKWRDLGGGGEGLPC